MRCTGSWGHSSGWVWGQGTRGQRAAKTATNDQSTSHIYCVITVARGSGSDTLYCFKPCLAHIPVPACLLPPCTPRPRAASHAISSITLFFMIINIIITPVPCFTAALPIQHPPGTPRPWAASWATSSSRRSRRCRAPCGGCLGSRRSSASSGDGLGCAWSAAGDGWNRSVGVDGRISSVSKGGGGSNWSVSDDGLSLWPFKGAVLPLLSCVQNVAAVRRC